MERSREQVAETGYLEKQRQTQEEIGKELKAAGSRTRSNTGAGGAPARPEQFKSLYS